MRLKTFSAPTMPAALQLVKKEFGDNAVILSTKKTKNAQGKFMLEITAGVEHPKPEDLPPSSPQPTAQYSRLADVLEQHGLSRQHVQRLSTATAGVAAADFSLADALEMVLGKLVTVLPISTQLPTPATHVFIGPSGTGKTTLIAKLAVQLTNQGQPVELFSCDTQRLSGFEPLAIVAEHLGIPATLLQPDTPIVLQNPDATLLLDTPGLNLRQPPSIQALRGVINRLPGMVITHLVIPAHGHPAVLSSLPYALRSLNPASLMITKLDEATQIGPWLNVALDSQLPLGLCTNSAGVHEPAKPLHLPQLTQTLLTPPEPYFLTLEDPS